MSHNVRVRFAPSPTGPLHIGGVRTALFNYLFAKKHNGTFILRIEDTDQNRFVKGAEQYIINALQWCGIKIDEGPNINEQFGPYKQSERKDLYKRYAEQLIASGHAYYAFDTNEAIEKHRKEHEANGKTFIYNWHNRLKLQNALTLSPKEVEEKLNRNEAYVVRFKTPQNETLHLTDLVRGHITIDTNTLDDKVLFKSDGMPTYHLANIVDDHLMQISHVIRGEEWLPSLALHQQLYNAFGWQTPKFAHLPLLLKPTGKGKLSKRDGDKLGFPVFPLEWTDPSTQSISCGYKEEGYFPEALINFLAFLGWNPGTEQEFFSLEDLIQHFSLDNINKSGARFDPNKIKWFNQHYMQKQDNNYLAEIFKPTVLKHTNKDIDNTYIAKVISLVKERASFPSDLWELSHYFFIAPENYDPKASKKAWKTDSPEIIRKISAIIHSINPFTAEALQTELKNWINDNQISFGKVMMPLRLALVGTLQGAEVFDIMFMIGKTETIKRIEYAINNL